MNIQGKVFVELSVIGKLENLIVRLSKNTVICSLPTMVLYYKLIITYLVRVIYNRIIVFVTKF